MPPDPGHLRRPNVERIAHTIRDMNGWAIVVGLVGVAASPVALLVQRLLQNKSEEAARKHEFRLRDYDLERELWERRVEHCTALVRVADDFLIRSAVDRRWYNNLAEGEVEHLGTHPSEKPRVTLDYSQLAIAAAAVQVVCPSEIATAARELARSLVELVDALNRIYDADGVVAAERDVMAAHDAFRLLVADVVTPPARQVV